LPSGLTQLFELDLVVRVLQTVFVLHRAVVPLFGFAVSLGWAALLFSGIVSVVSFRDVFALSRSLNSCTSDISPNCGAVA